MAERKRYLFADILKVFSALFIINSHFDRIYPNPKFASVGAIWIAMFFMVSGFCMEPIQKSFGQWIGEKLIRIYIPLFIVLIFGFLTVDKGMLTKENAFSMFIWPTKFWFVGAILLFYFLYYALRDVRTKKQFLLLYLGIGFLYAFWYVRLDTSEWVVEGGFFKYIYYFAIMMTGKYIKIHQNKFMKGRGLFLLQSFLAFFVSYGGKYVMEKNPSLFHLQFIFQFGVIWFATTFFLFSISLESFLKKYIPKRWKEIIEHFVGLTLELYLVQFIMITVCVNADVTFPLNIPLVLFMIFGGAEILHRVSNFLSGKITAIPTIERRKR